MPFWNRPSTRRLELEGLLSIEVPRNWRVRQADHFVEVLTPGKHDALQVSIHPRTIAALPPQAEERELLEQFLAQAGADSSLIVVERAGEASASFTVSDDETEFHFDVVARAWPSVAVIASFCYVRKDAATHSAALTALASIQPSADR